MRHVDCVAYLRLLALVLLAAVILYVAYRLLFPKSPKGKRPQEKPKAKANPGSRRPSSSSGAAAEERESGLPEVSLTGDGFRVNHGDGRSNRVFWEDVNEIEIEEVKEALFEAGLAVVCRGHGGRRWEVPMHARGIEEFQKHLMGLPGFNLDAFSNRKLKYPFACWSRVSSE